MSLAELIAGIGQQGGASIVTGTVGWSQGRPAVTIEGVQVPATWLDPVSVNYGDSVLVALTRGEAGQSSAIVLGRVTDTPRPTTGTVVSIGSGQAVVRTAFGTVSATHSWSAPSVGQVVSLLWQDGRPTTVGPVTYSAPDTPTAGPPPAPAQQLGQVDGVAVIRPAFSASWSARRSDGHPWTERIVVGGKFASTGAWGYGGQFAALKAIPNFRTVEASLHFGERTADGGNMPVTIQGRCHTAGSLVQQPTATGPSLSVALAKWAPGGQDVTLPADVAQWLVTNGGGLLWTGGSTEGGVSDIGTDPDSGRITIKWTTLPPAPKGQGV
jgi:hypothetical protein|uniref:Minor tail protein n=1 Tax=Siphoviridae sp. ctksc2 TaxID=2825645 RepID=A0A8S5URS3_9CAUD|nr:MAG TPA: hypothetical protein [Siphoviridae sp. ctksc2]